MGWINKMSDNIKKSLRSWLQIQPGSPLNVHIQEFADFELSAIKNQIWYRGDGNELEQLYGQEPEYADKYKFWASRCSPGQEIRKIHTGFPALIVRTLCSVVLPDMNDFKFKSPAQQELWEDMAKENDFGHALQEMLADVLVVGDGAWKVSIDTELSPYPILEWYPGDRVEFVRRRGHIREIIFKTPYQVAKQQYVLHEHYGYGYIKNHLYKGESEIDVNALDATKGITDFAFDSSVILAVSVKIYNNAKYAGRGASIFDGKLDSFDALDEAWSQWMDAVRRARAKTYVDISMVPRNEQTGSPLKLNPFDNSFFALQGGMSESDNRDPINVVQPTIPHEGYTATYITALDLCLQGIISPSTLGIDTKKLDNAEAQREKEKTTLYTRNAIVETFQSFLPDVVGAAINAYHILYGQPLEDVQVDVPFGEYANPSFESQVETVGKGRTQGIMSVEACVEELYGDTRDAKWKQEEVERLKAEQGITELEEPALSTTLGGFVVDEF